MYYWLKTEALLPSTERVEVYRYPCVQNSYREEEQAGTRLKARQQSAR